MDEKRKAKLFERLKEDAARVRAERAAARRKIEALLESKPKEVEMDEK
jgi:hypothetical protein